MEIKNYLFLRFDKNETHLEHKSCYSVLLTLRLEKANFWKVKAAC
jgi:hypothetical protein